MEEKEMSTGHPSEENQPENEPNIDEKCPMCGNPTDTCECFADDDGFGDEEGGEM